MPALDRRYKHKSAREHDPQQTSAAFRIHLAAELYSGRYYRGQSLDLSDLAKRHGVDEVSLLHVFKEFQTLGNVSFSGTSVIFQSTDPKDMQEAYEVRAAL